MAEQLSMEILKEWAGLAPIDAPHPTFVQLSREYLASRAEVERLRGELAFDKVAFQFLDDVMEDAVSVAWQEGYDDDGDPRTPEYGVGFEGDTPD